jgi:peptide/nickel transport system substrate-binding protein
VLKRLLPLIAFGGAALVAAGGPAELRINVRYEPRTLNPLLVQDESSELLRYLTGGVLIRLDRVTQELRPELATAWKVSRDGRTIRFTLRSGVKFSDGTPFDSADVAHTMRRLMDPELHSPTGDAFRTADGPPEVQVHSPADVSITFRQPVANLARLFDQVAILSSRSPKEGAVLGPYRVAQHVSGSHLLLERNPSYWRAGQGLPRIPAIRIRIQPNRDLEALALTRGEIDAVAGVDPVVFDKLARDGSVVTRDAGPSLDSEFFWFNQGSGGKLPEHKREWFRSRAFRNAVSLAINRDELTRVVYRGHAQPAVGPFPAANKLWFNTALKQRRHDPAQARKLLTAAGFRFEGAKLFDRSGNEVAFSLVTNAGNKTRERLAELVRRDLAEIGITVNITALDFPGLLERITRSFEYEACLLGLFNVDLDPNGQMNVWLSSSSNHQWNPSQKTPATPWEAELDKVMLGQARLSADKERKALFDRAQQIIYEQEPFIYLVHPNTLVAASRRLKNLHPATLRPQVLWNVEQLAFD